MSKWADVFKGYLAAYHLGEKWLPDGETLLDHTPYISCPTRFGEVRFSPAGEQRTQWKNTPKGKRYLVVAKKDMVVEWVMSSPEQINALNSFMHSPGLRIADKKLIGSAKVVFTLHVVGEAEPHDTLDKVINLLKEMEASGDKETVYPAEVLAHIQQTAGVTLPANRLGSAYRINQYEEHPILLKLANMILQFHQLPTMEAE
jgi:hypothetical protein